jgi:lipopolysaccharide export LptBFGC system permease protein LptF
MTASGQSLPKGENELTIAELRQRLESATQPSPPIAVPSAPPSLALTYHARWALGSAPMVAAVLVISVYYVIMYSARGLALGRTIPPFAAAWAPNVAFLMLSLAFTRLRSQGARDVTSAPRIG